MLNYQRNYMIYRILDSFFRNWLVFFITLLGISGVVGTALILRSAKYTASAAIRISAEEATEMTRTLGYKQDTGWSTPAQINTARFQDLLRETIPGGFIEKSVQAANLKNPINTDPRAKDPRFEDLIKGISVAPLSSNVIQVSLVWDDAAECQALVDAIQGQFILSVADDNTLASATTLTFLDTQIKEYQTRLQSAEKALVDFKKTHQGLMPDAMSGQLDALTSLKMQRDNLSITAQDSALKIQALKARLDQVKPVSILEQRVANDPAVGELRELHSQRARRIREGWQPTSSVIVEMDTKIRQLEGEVRRRQAQDPTNSRNVLDTTVADNPEYRDIQQQLVEAEIARKTQVAQMQALDGRIGQYEAVIAKLPADERTLTERTRDYKMLQEQFEDLVQRRQQAKIKRDLGDMVAKSQFNPLNEVTAESTATTKKKAIAIGTSLAVGLIMGLLLIVLREWMDPSLRYEADAVRMLEMPVLASLPENAQLRFPVRGGTRRLPGGSAPAIGGKA